MGETVGRALVGAETSIVFLVLGEEIELVFRFFCCVFVCLEARDRLVVTTEIALVETASLIFLGLGLGAMVEDRGEVGIGVGIDDDVG